MAGKGEDKPKSSFYIVSIFVLFRKNWYFKNWFLLITVQECLVIDCDCLLPNFHLVTLILPFPHSYTLVCLTFTAQNDKFLIQTWTLPGYLTSESAVLPLRYSARWLWHLLHTPSPCLLVQVRVTHPLTRGAGPIRGPDRIPCWRHQRLLPDGPETAVCSGGGKCAVKTIL